VQQTLTESAQRAREKAAKAAKSRPRVAC